MTRSDFKRWLYRGQRPNWIARILNRAWAAIASSGVAPTYLVTLEVNGRKSGRTASLPVVVTVVDGQRYVVSMLGENMHWVHNVRAAGGRAVLRSGGREEVHLEEVPADQRAPILRAYLQRAPGARPHVPVNKDAPIVEFGKGGRGISDLLGCFSQEGEVTVISGAQPPLSCEAAPLARSLTRLAAVRKSCFFAAMLAAKKRASRRRR